MKIVAVMNGWKDAPWCWPYFFRTPLTIRDYPTPPGWPRMVEISIVGFTLFVECRQRTPG